MVSGNAPGSIALESSKSHRSLFSSHASRSIVALIVSSIPERVAVGVAVAVLVEDGEEVAVAVAVLVGVLDGGMVVAVAEGTPCVHGGPAKSTKLYTTPSTPVALAPTRVLSAEPARS